MLAKLTELLNNLNFNQKEAVQYVDGPSLIIAGAGSGKTRVLTHKIAYLIALGYQPWSILSLTFTNKAAREMRERIGSLINREASERVWMGTFHSVFLRILKKECEHIGYNSSFTIYDTSDSKSLIKSIIKEMKLDDKIYKPSFVLNRISAAKNDLISAEAYPNQAEWIRQDILGKRPVFKEIYSSYVQRCRKANVMDFDDLLFNTNILFRDHPQILEHYQQIFQFILVDEYQDTNFSQYLILKKLAERHHKICVVGDDSQSIYSFRGANIENILHFKNNYPEGKLFKLEQNYRSTKTIVEAANSLIEKNKGQIPKKVFSDLEQGNKIKILSAYSDLEEGFMVSNKLSEMRLNLHADLNEFVILYRTNAQSRIFEEALRKRNIPYRVYGGLSFYQRKEIKDIIAYLRLLLNKDDLEAFKRIVNIPARGIGDTTINKLVQATISQGTGIWDVLEQLETNNHGIQSGIQKKLIAFRTLIEKFRGKMFDWDVYELTKNLLQESGINQELQTEHSPDYLSRKENLESLLAGMNEFVVNRIEEGSEDTSVVHYLQDVSLLTDQDETKNNAEDSVTLMTIHASKGLEFDHVFVVGMEEELFPSLHQMENEKNLEEERRLLYVAITRAKKTCTLSHAKSRYRNGQNNFTRPSRFLMDLDASLLDYPTSNVGFIKQSESPRFQKTEPTYHLPNITSTKRTLTRIEKSKTSAPATPTQDTASMQGIQIGCKISHDRFGMGVVTGIEDTGDNTKIEVEFEHSGYRKLLLKFARFTVINS